MASKQVVVCDNCNTEAPFLDLNTNDGDNDDQINPLNWIHVATKVVTKVVTDEDYPDEKYPDYAKHSGDFCSQACLLEWIQAPARVWNKPADE